MEREFKLYTTPRTKDLAEIIAKDLQVDLQFMHTEKFSDGEVFVRFDETIRGQTVFIISRMNLPYENIFEFFLAVDAAKRSSAKEVIGITPYLPHSRQERRDGQRTSVASRMMADILQLAGADRIITVEMHTNAIEGFFKVPVDHLQTCTIFAKHIKDLNYEDLCLCSPDFGGIKRIKHYKKHLDGDIAVIHKERLKPNQVAHMEIIGDVKGKNVIVIDDIIDTAGTLCKAAELIMEEGAKSITAYCTHALLTGSAIERIENSCIQKVYISDTIQAHVNSPKIQSISCGHLLAKAMVHLLSNKSVSQLNHEMFN